MPALNRIYSDLIKAGVFDGSRWFLYFDGNSYLKFPSIMLVGDFELSCKCYITKGINSSCILGNSENYYNSSIRLDFTNDRVRFVAQSSFADLRIDDLSSYKDRILNIDIKRIASDIELKINNKIIGNVTQGSEFLFDLVGSGDLTNQFFNGYIWDLNINNQYFLKLNKKEYPFLIFDDGLDSNGVELWHNPPDRIDSGLLDNGDGSYTNQFGGNLGYKSSKIPVGTYKIEFTCDNKTSVFSTGNKIGDFQAGSYAFVAKIDGYGIWFDSGAYVTTISNVSIKETTAAQGYNFQESSFTRSLNA